MFERLFKKERKIVLTENEYKTIHFLLDDIYRSNVAIRDRLYDITGVEVNENNVDQMTSILGEQRNIGARYYHLKIVLERAYKKT